MLTAWSIIASFDYFEDFDCPENVYVRSINWNLLSFVVFLYRFFFNAYLLHLKSEISSSKNDIAYRKILQQDDMPLVNQYTPINGI